MGRQKHLSGAVLAIFALDGSTAAAGPTVEGLRLAAIYKANKTELQCRDTAQKEVLGLGAALLSAVIGPAVKAGIKGIGTALTKAGQDVTANVSGDATDTFFRIVDNSSSFGIVPKSGACVLLAVGVGEGQGPSPTLPGANAQLDALGFKNAPSFAMLAALQLSSDGTAWRLVPASLYVGNALTKGGSFRSSDRDLVLQITLFGAAAKTEDDAAIATRSIVIGRQPGKSAAMKSGMQIAYLGTSWMPLPPVPPVIAAEVSTVNQRKTDLANLQVQIDATIRAISEAKTPKEKEALTKVKLEAERQKGKLAQLIEADEERIGAYSDGIGPFSLSFRLVETRDGSKFLRDFGAFLTDSSEVIAKPVADAISPASRQAARDEDLQTALTGIGTETDARVAAVEAVAAWQAGVSGAKPASELATLRLKASAACRKLELSGFAQVDCLSLE